MQSRNCAAEQLPPSDLVLRTPPNWVAVIFLGMLAGLHLANAIPSLLAGRWAGYLSLIFGSLLGLASLAVYHFRCEMTFRAEARVLRLRTGVGRLSSVRHLRFSAVRGVRLTVEDGGGKHRDAVIELLCPGEDLACPPTKIPRQQALYLAMLIGVPLTKVSATPFDVPEPDLDDGRLEAAGARIAG